MKQLPDLFTILGLALVAVGLGLAWLPLGVIGAGAAFATLGFGLERDQ